MEKMTPKSRKQPAKVSQQAVITSIKTSLGRVIEDERSESKNRGG